MTHFRMVAALVAATELARICGFIGEEFRPEMLDIAPIGVAPLGVGRFVTSLKATEPVDPTRSGRWVRDLDAGKKRDVAYHAGALLTALGHAIGDICIDLVTAYAVDAETYSRDVLVFANDLIRRGLAKAA